MELSIERIEFLLLVAAVVSMVVRRLHLPYTVALVLAGGALALSHAGPRVELTRHLIFDAFLPPLIFEAAFHIRWRELHKDLAVVSLLATAGVVLSAAAIAVGMHSLAQWPWSAAWLFAIPLSATDPVAVIATFREAGVQGRLRLLMEAESIFNDGTAAVMFVVAQAVLEGTRVSAGAVLLSFAMTVAGGLLCGAVVAGFVLLLLGRTEDPLVEMALTTVAAYGSFALAEHLGLSGVLATLAAGMLVGNVGPLGAISDRGHQTVEMLWEYLAFVVNSLVFLLIGMRVAERNITPVFLTVVAAIALVTLGRAVAVYPLSLVFVRSAARVPMRLQHVLFWGGLRGALALALVLGLDHNTPHQAEITTVAFAVVAWSVIVQGLTINPLLKRLGET